MYGAMIPSAKLSGYGFAIASSVGLGAAVALSRAAYDGGTDPLSVAAARSIAGSGFLIFVCLATRTPMGISGKQWCHCAGLGALMAFMFYGNIGAVKYIPVGLAALLFFIYPPLVALFMARLDRRPLEPVTALALFGAFLGLALMLGVSLNDLDWRGVAIGLSAGFACACNVTWIGRKMRDMNTLVMTLHMTLVACAIIVTVLFVVDGGFNLPHTRGGWLGATGVVFFQSTSIVMFFAAIPRIGAVSASMLNNLQPVSSIVLAMILFGEVLSPAQSLGGAMVIGGILLMQWRQAR